MQTLEDVLLLAMKGEDPFVVDALLRKRGDYRPHTQFGVDLAARALLRAAEEGALRLPLEGGGAGRRLTDRLCVCLPGAMVCWLLPGAVVGGCRRGAHVNTGAAAGLPSRRWLCHGHAAGAARGAD